MRTLEEIAARAPEEYFGADHPAGSPPDLAAFVLALLREAAAAEREACVAAVDSLHHPGMSPEAEAALVDAVNAIRMRR